MFAGNFAPTGWAFCNGQLLPISQNTALFSLLGTNYGGDGKSTFGLPNLGSRTPIAAGQGAGLSIRDLGETGGSATVTLLESGMPNHRHTASGVAAGGNANSPAGAAWAEPHLGRVADQAYAAAPSTTMHPQSLAMTGGGAPHNNLPPYLVVTFIIALQGVYPPRS